MTSPLAKTADACKRVSHQNLTATSTLVTPKPLPWTSASLNVLEECAISVWTTPTHKRKTTNMSKPSSTTLNGWAISGTTSTTLPTISKLFGTLPSRSSNKVALMSTNKVANRLQLKRELPLVLVQKAPIEIVQWKNRFVFLKK